MADDASAGYKPTQSRAFPGPFARGRHRLTDDCRRRAERDTRPRDGDDGARGDYGERVIEEEPQLVVAGAGQSEGEGRPVWPPSRACLARSDTDTRGDCLWPTTPAPGTARPNPAYSRARSRSCP